MKPKWKEIEKISQANVTRKLHSCSSQLSVTSALLSVIKNTV